MMYDLPSLEQETDMSESNPASFSFFPSQNETFLMINPLTSLFYFYFYFQ